MTKQLLDHSLLGTELGLVPYDHPFRAEIRQWLTENLPEHDEPRGDRERFDYRRRWHERLAEGGWVGLHWPVEFGGRGLGPLIHFMYNEELALARAPEPVNTAGSILIAPTLLALASPELQERFLPKILSGEEIWCQGFSEPNAGSDLASLRTRAVRDGEEWVVNGQKIWVTAGAFADYCFVLCRTEPDSERHRGLSLLVCPTNQPGVEVRPIRQISGDSEYSEIFFEDARLPAAWIVGEEGQGWSAAMTLFQFERSDQGYTDHARLLVELYETAAELEESARSSAVSIDRAGQLEVRLDDLWERCQELRAVNYRGAVLARDGQDLGAIGSLTNLLWGELAKEVGELRAEANGAGGVDADSLPSYLRLASRASSIYSGTSEIQRNIIAERLLGLPR
ncbi:acyl-CoA dehydrogenase family protein [Salinibacterium sp. ZJ454]|uniref:acyl-CoA dehydrogenase family protein n=1 Tax=Salinibacterium sp. ZJ454 TaxID=2708339 RepID=UPI00142015BC|nr:acyl-CoA dehydrogenase family protein [Salinibacterium sp. ZJ454]